MRTKKLIKICVLFFFPFFTLFIFKSCNCKKTVHQQPLVQPKVVNAKGKPTKLLLDLLIFLNIKHDGTLQDIVKVTQKRWLRKIGSERWQIRDEYKVQEKDLLGFFEKMGLTQEVLSARKYYDFALVLGALASRVRSRLAYLIKLWDKGVRFKKIVFLGGARPLDPVKENKSVLLDIKNKILVAKKDWQFSGNLPKTETEMMKLVFDQTKLSENFKKLDVIFVDAPMKKGPNGQVKRPTTPDTVYEWLGSKPMHGSCLVISNQPYVGYQDSVLKTILPKSFYLETVGEKADIKKSNISILLDTVARFLYQENKRLNS